VRRSSRACRWSGAGRCASGTPPMPSASSRARAPSRSRRGRSRRSSRRRSTPRGSRCRSRRPGRSLPRSPARRSCRRHERSRTSRRSSTRSGCRTSRRSCAGGPWRRRWHFPRMPEIPLTRSTFATTGGRPDGRRARRRAPSRTIRRRSSSWTAAAAEEFPGTGSSPDWRGRKTSAARGHARSSVSARRSIRRRRKSPACASISATASPGSSRAVVISPRPSVPSAEWKPSTYRSSTRAQIGFSQRAGGR